MTTPVVLYGTQSNGETLPVQVDATGRLVAEGLKGDKGEPGDPGAPGADGEPGGAFPLPPNPYEGALLGWKNGELAWLASDVIVIPESVFGPITEIDELSGSMVVGGTVPSDLLTGTYIDQCEKDGTLTSGLGDASKDWVSMWKWNGATFANGTEPLDAFDGDLANRFRPVNGTNSFEWDLLTAGIVNETVDIWLHGTNLNRLEWKWNSGNWQEYVGSSQQQWNLLGRIPNQPVVNIKFRTRNTDTNYQIGGFRIGEKIAIDPSLKTSFRVTNVTGNLLTGTPMGAFAFEVGKYLKVPEQRVARWVTQSQSDFGY